MARRTLWLAAGALVGAGSSLYAERKVRRSLEQAAGRLRPDSLVLHAGQSARQAASATGGRVRDALDSGRAAAARREQELWASLDHLDVPAGDPVASTSARAGEAGGTGRSGAVIDGRVVGLDGGPVRRRPGVARLRRRDRAGRAAG